MDDRERHCTVQRKCYIPRHARPDIQNQHRHCSAELVLRRRLQLDIPSKQHATQSKQQGEPLSKCTCDWHLSAEPELAATNVLLLHCSAASVTLLSITNDTGAPKALLSNGFFTCLGFSFLLAFCLRNAMYLGSHCLWRTLSEA